MGVFGGIGPQATMDFETRVHRVAQQRGMVKANGGYPPMIVHYHRRPPVLIDEKGHARVPIQLDPGLIEAIARLGKVADFIVITSNGPHAMQDEIERLAGKPIVSMADRVVAESQRRGWRRVGLLGLGIPFVYTMRFDAIGVPYEVAPEDQRDRLDRAIFGVMEGRTPPEARRAATEAIAGLEARGVDGVILGCTEIPFLVDDPDDRPAWINPIQILAEAAVTYAAE